MALVLALAEWLLVFSEEGNEQETEEEEEEEWCFLGWRVSHAWTA